MWALAKVEKVAKNVHKFRRTEAARLIKAARDERLKIRGISVDSDGTLTVLADDAAAAEPPPNPWETDDDNAQPKRTS
jgi:hypothetical protein